MCQNALGELESDGLNLNGVIMKRAQWEALEVSVADERHVNVRNASKAEPSVYTVEVENGVPAACTCPYDQHNADPCKHRVHVAMNDLLMGALRAAKSREVATDGGEVLGPEADAEREQEAVCSSLSAVERADALGLDHAGGCSDEDPVDEKLRCWRCYYLDSVSDDGDE